MNRREAGLPGLTRGQNEGYRSTYHQQELSLRYRTRKSYGRTVITYCYMQARPAWHGQPLPELSKTPRVPLATTQRGAIIPRCIHAQKWPHSGYTPCRCNLHPCFASRP